MRTTLGALIGALVVFGGHVDAQITVSSHPEHADSVRVDSSAADTLAKAYTPAREGEWCIQRYHVEHLPNGAPVPAIDSVSFLAWGDSLGFADPHCFILHTHPPGYPIPAWADIGIGVFQRGEPFVAIQYGPRAFSSWNTGDVK